MRWRRITLALAALAAVAACAWLLSSPSSAAAATPHPIGGGSIFDAVGNLVGGVFSSLGHAVLGAFTWTIELASKFILITGGALVKLLIPSSSASQGPADHGLDRPGPQLRRQDRLAGRRQPLRVLRDERAARPVHVARDRDRPVDTRLRDDAGDARRARTRRDPRAPGPGGRGRDHSVPVPVDAGRGAGRSDHARDPEHPGGSGRPEQADGVRRRRRCAWRLAADRPRADRPRSASRCSA